MFKKYIKSIIREVLVDYMKEDDVQREYQKTSNKRIANQLFDGSLNKALKMHSKGFKDMSTHIKYISKIGTNEEHVIREVHDLLKFYISDIDDDIMEITDITCFPKSFQHKDRMSCVNLIKYGTTRNEHEAELLIMKIKEEIRKFPEILV